MSKTLPSAAPHLDRSISMAGKWRPGHKQKALLYMLDSRYGFGWTSSVRTHIRSCVRDWTSVYVQSEEEVQALHRPTDAHLVSGFGLAHVKPNEAGRMNSNELAHSLISTKVTCSLMQFYRKSVASHSNLSVWTAFLSDSSKGLFQS